MYCHMSKFKVIFTCHVLSSWVILIDTCQYYIQPLFPCLVIVLFISTKKINDLFYQNLFELVYLFFLVSINVDMVTLTKTSHNNVSQLTSIGMYGSGFINFFFYEL
jgi:hypothetical protein